MGERREGPPPPTTPPNSPTMTPKKVAKKTTAKKGPKGAKGGRKKKGTESYKIYIYKVLKQVHPDTGISSKSMSIMSSASEALEKVLEEVTINDPQVPVFSNVTATQFPDAAGVRPLLKRQLCEPVRWEDTLRALIGAGKSSMYELGPNKQIRSMVKRVDGD